MKYVKMQNDLQPYKASPVSNKLSHVIVVKGEGTVEVDPDIAIVEMGVVSFDENPKIAQENNDSAINNIIESMLTLGIDEKDIKTIEYIISPKYDYENGQQKLKGYEVRHILKITARNIDLIGDVIELGVTNGVNYQRNIQFSLSDDSLYYNEALDLAVEDAKNKAATIANSIGGTLINYPIRVVEKGVTTTAPRYTNGFVKEGTAPIESGTMQIYAGVDAAFEYTK